MNHTDTLAGIRASMQSALKLSDADAAVIGLDTTAAQLPGWSSMAHLELVLAIENRFAVIFDAEEIGELASVAAILKALAKVRPN